MILIPAAGEGSRFREAGYKQPKHLLDVGGRPMIRRVSESVFALEPGIEPFVATQENVGQTKGAVHTILRANEVMPIPRDKPLVVANCDQLVTIENPVMRGDGIVYTFPSNSPAHSYVETEGEGVIRKIAEKRVISNRAVSGVYWFREAGPFLDACQWVLDTCEGELYVSSALHKMIHEGARLYAVDAPTAILGTPEDYQRFLVAYEFARAA